jgi:hypothetical protein
MMGSNDKPQDELFYAFNLEEIVPEDHLLRDIDRVLDLSNLREHLAPFYSHTGRPSIDPELMIRMLLIGYCCGIRSERQLQNSVPKSASQPVRSVAVFPRRSSVTKIPGNSQRRKQFYPNSGYWAQSGPSDGPQWAYPLNTD